MAENFNIEQVNQDIIYRFRFGTSDQCIDLSQEQINLIPYLSVLIEHKNDFLSCQNENGEYVLNPPVHYQWFIPILYSVTLKQPHVLFNELSHDENILDVLRLFDYLLISPFDGPLLKDKHLVLSQSVDSNEQFSNIKYESVTKLIDVRNTAAEFMLAISKNEYNLEDFNTKNSVFDLILIILTNKDVFSSRFRYHTSTIVKEYCYSSLSKQQKCQFRICKKIIRDMKIDALIYLYDDDRSIPENFPNPFVSKEIYNIIEENNIDVLESNQMDDDWFDIRVFYEITYPFWRHRELVSPNYLIPSDSLPWHSSGIDERLWTFPQLLTSEERYLKKHYISEAKSARSYRFNTLPKRPTVDKFKPHMWFKSSKISIKLFILIMKYRNMSK